MRPWLLAAALIGLLSSAFAYEVELTQKDDARQKCNGMYSEAAWGGSVSPYIMTVFDNASVSDNKQSIVSFVIFEWKDEALIGYDDGTGIPEYICDPQNVQKKYCNESQIGEFILAPNATKRARNPIITKAIDLRKASPINYEIKKTGYYCIYTWQYTNDNYHAVVEFRNAYGELPAAQIPKLPFYGGLTILYALICIFWAFLYFQNRHDILPVQNYITAILGFLVIEQLLTWGYYDYQNRHGNNLGNKVLMIVTAILNAFRNSFSFFLLLIVCMGYGVVKPSLGKTMWYVRALALTHFVFGVVYGIASLSITPDSAGPVVLLVIMPLAGSLTAFYVWTLNSLSATMKDLLERKQSVKALMYKRLWWCILGSILVIFAFFFLNSFTFATRDEEDFVPNNWKNRWFVLDGWLNIVYLFDICFVAYLWRPTFNNRRFAMSDELAQDDDGGFEIASFRNSLDSDASPIDGGESGKIRGVPSDSPPGYSAATGHARDSDEDDSESEKGKKSNLLGSSNGAASKRNERRSLEGETIFAVGDEDEGASSDDDSEGGRLTGRK